MLYCFLNSVLLPLFDNDYKHYFSEGKRNRVVVTKSVITTRCEKKKYGLRWGPMLSFWCLLVTDDQSSAADAVLRRMRRSRNRAPIMSRRAMGRAMTARGMNPAIRYATQLTAAVVMA